MVATVFAYLCPADVLSKLNHRKKINGVGFEEASGCSCANSNGTRALQLTTPWHQVHSTLKRRWDSRVATGSLISAPVDAALTVLNWAAQYFRCCFGIDVKSSPSLLAESDLFVFLSASNYRRFNRHISFLECATFWVDGNTPRK